MVVLIVRSWFLSAPEERGPTSPALRGMWWWCHPARSSHACYHADLSPSRLLQACLVTGWRVVSVGQGRGFMTSSPHDIIILIAWFHHGMTSPPRRTIMNRWCDSVHSGKNIFQVPLTTISSESSRIAILSLWTKSHFTFFSMIFVIFQKNIVSQIVSQKLAPGTADSDHNRSLKDPCPRVLQTEKKLKFFFRLRISWNSRRKS